VLGASTRAVSAVSAAKGADAAVVVVGDLTTGQFREPEILALFGEVDLETLRRVER